MGLRGLIMGLRGLIWGVQELIWGLRGLILSSRDQISGPSRLDEGLRPLKGGDGRKDGRTDGRLEITPCVLQDIGPLGPLPKKEEKEEEEKIPQMCESICHRPLQGCCPKRMNT